MDNKAEVIKEGQLNVVIIKTTKRPNGTTRIQQDFEFCPTMAEQHTAHMSDINYLMQKFKPDELASYLAARTQHRQEIIGHDFSQEPNLQEAQNIVYKSRMEFEKLPDDVKLNFKSHLEFLKFIDNPANAEKMVKLGLISKKEIEKIKIEEQPAVSNDQAPRTQDEKQDQKEKSPDLSKNKK